MTDGKTDHRARELGIDLFDVLKRHDSTTALKALGDAVVTGPTGTNVVNLRIMIIEKGR
jgi:glycerate 2-kinase